MKKIFAASTMLCCLFSLNSALASDSSPNALPLPPENCYIEQISPNGIKISTAKDCLHFQLASGQEVKTRGKLSCNFHAGGELYSSCLTECKGIFEVTTGERFLFSSSHRATVGLGCPIHDFVKSNRFKAASKDYFSSIQ